ncbi:telomeric repeat binding factor a [Cottoperca gobio]|uniref:Telomeric repeat binding factor a n=1 Tax=Cottoperca gobio TaxID=56716 RepID=A0A6J2RUV6_COTGO|nr:telomeric repeat-binding factor 2 [Cottoperca gobio]
MASKGQTDVESFVNRWIVDYYSLLALELFKNKKHDDFCGIIAILDSILVRPVVSTDVTPTKIRVLHFLTRINEGDNLDVTFEPDQSVTPLESALMVLEDMSQGCSLPLPQQDFKNVCASLKEMMVGMLIKNKKFDKAKEVLNKHFPKPMVGKKAIFMHLINRKSKMHEVIEQIDFQRFKDEMLAFCQSLFNDVPFLFRAAMQFIDESRLRDQDDQAAVPDEQDEAGPSTCPQIDTVQVVPCKRTIIQRTRLEAAYKALGAYLDEKTFAQLEEEMEEEEQARKEDIPPRLPPTPKKGTNQDSEQDGLFQRDSGSPMEASPADPPPQTDAVSETQAGWLSKMPSVPRNRQPYTVARLVVEPDSQGSSQCTTVSQELETDVRTEEPAPSVATPNKEAEQSLLPENEVTIPIRKHPRRGKNICSRASTSFAESSAESEEDTTGSEATREMCVGKSHNHSKSSPVRNSSCSKQLSSDSDEDPEESPALRKTPPRNSFKRARILLSKVPDAISIADSSLDSSPELFPRPPVPQTSSTPHKDSPRDKGHSGSKWKKLYNTAKESKDTWSDEESYFGARKSTASHNESTNSNSGNRKRKWSDRETQKLKEGVEKFGEGNWSKIKAYYSFSDRTNVNLKDRWRTMKKLKIV